MHVLSLPHCMRECAHARCKSRANRAVEPDAAGSSSIRPTLSQSSNNRRLKERKLPYNGNKQALLDRLEAADAAPAAKAEPGPRAGCTAAAAASGAASFGRQGQRPPKPAAKPQARQNFVRINMRVRPTTYAKAPRQLSGIVSGLEGRDLSIIGGVVELQGGGRFKFKSKSGSNGSTKRFKRFPRGRGAGCALSSTLRHAQQSLQLGSACWQDQRVNADATGQKRQANMPALRCCLLLLTWMYTAAQDAEAGGGRRRLRGGLRAPAADAVLQMRRRRPLGRRVPGAHCGLSLLAPSVLLVGVDLPDAQASR